MLAILAAILFAVGYIENSGGDHTSAWLSPSSLMLAGLFVLALHLLGVGNWTRKP